MSFKRMRHIFFKRRALFGLLLGLAVVQSAVVQSAVAQPAAGADAAGDTLVFAAASLKDALDACISRFEAQRGAVQNNHIKASYAATSMLARQIEAGAPADIFISADVSWMDEVEAKGLTLKGSRIDLLGNDLVLIAPRRSSVSIILAAGVDLGAYLGAGRLAVADPDHVPAGIYAKAALTSLGAWGGVESRLARAENVRSALALVSRGEVPLGIVYGSDLMIDPMVRRVATFPEASHPPIIYPAALLRATSSPTARVFFVYLKGAEAAAIFHQFGFTPLK